MKYALAGIFNLLAILATIAGFVLAFVVDNGNFILLSMVVGLPAVLVTSFMVSATDGVPEEIACRQVHRLHQANDEADALAAIDRLLFQLDAQTADLQAALDGRPVPLKVSDRRAAGASVPPLYAGITTQWTEEGTAPRKPPPRPLAPDPDLLICHCRTCGRGPGVCGPMRELRAAKARRELLSHLTDTDRDWLHRYGWDGS